MIPMNRDHQALTPSCFGVADETMIMTAAGHSGAHAPSETRPRRCTRSSHVWAVNDSRLCLCEDDGSPKVVIDQDLEWRDTGLFFSAVITASFDSSGNMAGSACRRSPPRRDSPHQHALGMAPSPGSSKNSM